MLTRLPILIVYPHSRCDCRCAMCDIWRRTETLELTAATVDSWRDDLLRLGVEEVVFSGGEPLMCSDIASLAEAFRAVVPRLTLLTTGQRLAEKAEVAARVFDSIIVSLDGPREVHDHIRRVSSAYDQLADGVHAVRERRPALPIHARCTVQRPNHRLLRETAAAARQLGLDSISFLAADVSSDAFDHDPAGADALQQRVGLTIEETNALAAAIEQLIADETVAAFVRETPSKLRAIAARFRARLGIEQPVAPPCTAPWVSAVVETTGVLRPCFFHPPVGDVQKQGLAGAVNSDTAVLFRRNLDVASNPVCQNCVCSLNRPVESG